LKGRWGGRSGRNPKKPGKKLVRVRVRGGLGKPRLPWGKRNEGVKSKSKVADRQRERDRRWKRNQKVQNSRPNGNKKKINPCAVYQISTLERGEGGEPDPSPVKNSGKSLSKRVRSVEVRGKWQKKLPNGN